MEQKHADATAPGKKKLKLLNRNGNNMSDEASEKTSQPLLYLADRFNCHVCGKSYAYKQGLIAHHKQKHIFKQTTETEQQIKLVENEATVAELLKELVDNIHAGQEKTQIDPNNEWLNATNDELKGMLEEANDILELSVQCGIMFTQKRKYVTI